jgi:hypothetical protein
MLSEALAGNGLFRLSGVLSQYIYIYIYSEWSDAESPGATAVDGTIPTVPVDRLDNRA